MSILRAEVLGSEAVDERIQKLKLALDTTEILDEGAALLLNRIRERFLAQTDPNGEAWIPSRASIRRKATGQGGGTLYDSGRLFHSIQLFSIGANERAIGTDVPYAVDHNTGINGQLKREFLGFGKGDGAVVQQLVLKRISEALK